MKLSFWRYLVPWRRFQISTTWLMGAFMALVGVGALLNGELSGLAGLRFPLFAACFVDFVYGKQAFDAERLLVDLLPPADPPPPAEGAYR